MENMSLQAAIATVNLLANLSNLTILYGFLCDLLACFDGWLDLEQRR